jgi:hypothetical protein
MTISNATAPAPAAKGSVPPGPPPNSPERGRPTWTGPFARNLFRLGFRTLHPNDPIAVTSRAGALGWGWIESIETR